MSTTNELLDSLTREAAEQSGTIVYYEIDPETRIIDIPTDLLLGVESDERVNRVYFTCPKVVGDNIDLTKLDLRVNFMNANGKKGYDPIDDVEASKEDPERITFSWLLSRDVTIQEGSVSFNICAILKDGYDIKNEWNTVPATARSVLGLEPDIDVNADINNDMSMVRGDTFMAVITIRDEYGKGYTPKTGDSLVFTMKQNLDDTTPALVKNIPLDTLKLVIIPEDTQELAVGTYTYNVKLTLTTGEVYSVIASSFFRLIKEVA